MMNKITYFDEIAEVLDYLDNYQIPWGVVTNKSSWLIKTFTRIISN